MNGFSILKENAVENAKARDRKFNTCDPFTFSGYEALLMIDFYNKIIWRCILASRYDENLGFQSIAQWSTLEAICDSSKIGINTVYKSIFGDHNQYSISSMEGFEFIAYDETGDLIEALEFIRQSMRSAKIPMHDRMYQAFLNTNKSFNPQIPNLVPVKELLQWNTLLNFEQCKNKSCLHRYQEGDRYIVFSHKWESVDHPDPMGSKLLKMKKFLETNNDIQYVWIDFCSIPQKSENGKVDLDQVFSIPHIIKQSSGLKLINSKVEKVWSRAWCFFEQALAFGLGKSYANLDNLKKFNLSELSCNKEAEMIMLAGLLYFELADNFSFWPWLLYYSAHMAQRYISKILAEDNLEKYGSSFGLHHNQLGIGLYLRGENIYGKFHEINILSAQNYQKNLHSHLIPAVTPCRSPLFLNESWVEENKLRLKDLKCRYT